MTMVNHGPMSHCDKYCLNSKINHGPTSHCDKDILNIKIDHVANYGQPCVFYGLYNIIP